MEKLVRISSHHPDFNKLVALLNEDLALRDGEDNSFYAQFNGITKDYQSLVLYVNNTAVACGAIKKFNAEAVEVKRMFVSPESRGKGMASKVLKGLELWAKELGFKACVLETGLRQPEAIALYKKNGYLITENYPPYEGIENSVCFKKVL